MNSSEVHSQNSDYENQNSDSNSDQSLDISCDSNQSIRSSSGGQMCNSEQTNNEHIQEELQNEGDTCEQVEGK